MIYRFSKLVIDYRHLFFVIIFILSVFFGYHAFKTEMVSNFEDLIPRNHHYVKLHREFKNLFGGANLISIAVEVKNGDIFNRDTLNKIKAINDMIELTHGVNNYQIHSIARHNVKDIRATSWGIEANSLMYPYVPETQEEIDKLRDVIYGNEAVYGKLVSRDGKAALIQADFWEKRLDYRYLFNRVVKTCRSLEDENTNIYVAGEPILYGWVYHHFREIFFIMLVTILAIILLLVFYIRRLEGVIIPLISAFITGLWGLGFTKLFGFNFDPLTLIIPFVIGARTISHSIQMTERFFEEYKELRDEKAAAIMSLNGLLMPGFVSIVTDACGVLVIAIAPIPILQKLAFIGSLWVLTNLVSVLILAPILYTYFPIHKIKSEREGQGRIDYFFKIAGFWCVGRRSKGVILGFTILLVAWSGYNLKNLCVGDVNPGSPILWHDSEYNRSVARINSKFAGTNQMLVVVRGEKPEAVKNPQIIMKIEALERSEKEDPRVGGSISVVSLIKNLHKCYHYDCPKWFFVPEEDYLISGYFRNLLESGEPGDFNRFADWSFQYASINFFLKDHKGDTIRHVIKRVKDFISKNTLPGASFELAGGFIGLVAAANEVIARSHEINLFVILSLTYIFCALAYRSFVGGILFIISLLIANIFTLAVMAVSEIGLNVNTIPVITLGIGLGVDYGLYVVSRIKEEYVRQKNLEMAVITSISTAGKAVVYTATLITFGVVLWYFSPLRFQAEMGLLLALVLIMNMLGAIFLIPTLIYFVKPRFIKSLRR